MHAYNKGCRCDDCRETSREYTALRRLRYRNGDIKRRKPMSHGKFYTYAIHGCRCSECRKANAMHQRKIQGTSMYLPYKKHKTKEQIIGMTCKICGVHLMDHPLVACWRKAGYINA